MVPLINHSYLGKFTDDRHMSVFVQFVNGWPIMLPGQLDDRNANDIALLAMNAMREGDRGSFLAVYESIGVREPSVDASWIYNDILLFVLTIGVVKFSIESTWIAQVLALRVENSRDEKNEIARSLSDVLSGHVEDSGIMIPIQLVAQNLLSIDKVSGERLNRAYNEVIKIEFPSSSDFINIIALRAYDLIITLKEHNPATGPFLKKYPERVKSLSKWTARSISLIFLILTALYVISYLGATGEERESYEQIIGLISLVVGGLSIKWVFLPGKLASSIERAVHLYFGYKEPTNPLF